MYTTHCHLPVFRIFFSKLPRKSEVENVFHVYSDVCVHIIKKMFTISQQVVLLGALTLYIAVTQFTYGKLRHCYVKS